ncbi:MAG: carboxylating nicotinate-nucleotide diphosphorylase [Alphaproteobacteria bacterium]|nr:carboxylating nicotinate-nucleotide diphosphorylase [Alphaproteobacteria bacterium]
MTLSLDITRPPSALLFEPAVRAALEEDLGRAGDITSQLTIPSDKQAAAKIVVRKPGRIAGLICAEAAFRLVDPSVKFEVLLPDGSDAAAGAVLATVSGSARSILTAERVALNFLGPLSGTATATAALVKAVEGTAARIVCTRKTLPGLRALQKYAVRCGGGFNHRFGLDDAAMVKDNHVQAAGGIGPAVARLRECLGHMVRIEVEVDRLEQLEEALTLGVDRILLDNISLDDLNRAVALSKDKAVLEASGNVTLATVRAIAETGVDYISSGAITHSALNLDIGLDF